MLLEQIILRHGAQENSINIKEMHEGIDFYYKNRMHAQRMVDFVCSKVPAKYKCSKELIGHDIKSSVYNYKYTFSVEIVPICKDDLILLPKADSRKMGGIGPLVVCYKVSNFLHLIDVQTMQGYDLDATQFWKFDFTSLLSRSHLTEFIVLNVEGEHEEGKLNETVNTTMMTRS